MTIHSTVKLLRAGVVLTAVEVQRTVSPDRVFNYALTELDGFCTIDDLYKAFRKENVSRREIMDILREFEVSGAPPALEPEIELGEDELVYYLAPSPGGRVPRKLIKAEQFIAEFETKWGAILAVRVPSSTKIGKTHEGDISKIQEALEADEANDLLAQELQEEYEMEFFEGKDSYDDETYSD